LVHQTDVDEIHKWGYHQLEASIRAHALFNEDKFLEVFKKTTETVVQDAVEKNFYYSYPLRAKNGLCAYCISPIARGLFEAYIATRDEKYKTMFMKCANWFYDGNEFNQHIYDKSTGACYDGIDNGKVSVDCGAESSIEAGFVELKRIILQDTD
jgi:hypothetical protein